MEGGGGGERWENNIRSISAIDFFFSSFLEMGGDLKWCFWANNGNNSFPDSGEENGVERGEKGKKKSQKQRLCLWIIITHVYKGSDKTRREYLFIFKYFSSLNTLKRVTQCAFFSLQCFSGFYFALLSLFLPALLFREETFWLFHHSHFRLSARLPPLSFNLEKNEQRCWVHLSTSLLFIVLTLCSLSFLACCS